MKKSVCIGFLAVVVTFNFQLSTFNSYGAEKGLVGYWPFDNNFADVSGAGNDGKGAGLGFDEGRKGMALKLEGQRMEIPNSPQLQLSPGFTIDCWVYFDRIEGYPQIVLKDKEYQLRVDGEGEGRKFSFFVFLDGQWEPRASSIVPEAGKWHHVVAKWTGNELSLEVDGSKTSNPRLGGPVPNNNPVYVGFLFGKVDELKIQNPGFARNQKITTLMEKIQDSQRSVQSSFGITDGWKNWIADEDVKMSIADNVIKAKLPRESMIYTATLDVNVSKKRYVAIDIEAKESQEAMLFFITEKGYGSAVFPVWGKGRTSIVDTTGSPQWGGKLKFLGISLMGEKEDEIILRNIWVSEKIEGAPFVYVRNLAPGSAIIRNVREEKIVAVVHNLGADAKDLEVKLNVPGEVRILDDYVKKIQSLAYNKVQKLEWKVIAAQPFNGALKAIVSCKGQQNQEKSVPVNFQPQLNLPKASYVPEPKPVKSKYIALMHYCPLWKVGTHYGWGKIENWPERKPAIGWYDEGTPEVADWHIKYMVEHGIQGFIYCWYRKDLDPEIHQMIGHAVHDGLLKAKYLDKFKFVIMWENGCAKGVKSIDDMMENLLPYWMKNYFKHPSYLKIDNRPVLYIWRPARVAPEVGGSDGVREMFDKMREECKRQGFDGLYIIGCTDTDEKQIHGQMAKEGWDASSAYVNWGTAKRKEKIFRDNENITAYSSDSWFEGQKEILLGKKKLNALPDIANVTVNWDPRPWHGEKTSWYIAGNTKEKFKNACISAKKIIDSTPGNGLDKRIVVFDNWNEFGEGHYIESCSGYGFDFVDAIREVFCEDAGPHYDIVPEDVGLETPDRIYRMLKGEIKQGQITASNLIVHLPFDKENDQFVLDTSGSGINALKGEKFELTEGLKGKGLLCAGGNAMIPASDFLFPSEGLTIELWFKTDVAKQFDKWFVNTIGAANTGYRLGLVGGKVSFQIPVTPWSHMLSCPEPADLGRWVNVTATYDKNTMKIYTDGELKASLERTGEINSSGAGMCIGNYSAGHSKAFFEGIIDEVKIYNRALSADEIKEHFKK